MTFTEVYKRIIQLWGDSIEFSDGNNTKPKNAFDTPGTTPTNDNYFHSESFSQLWTNIEEIVGTDDTYGDLMVWTMYQVFHRHAKNLFQNGIVCLSPKAIDKNEIEAQYFINLNGESWEEELAQYERIIK